jgi:hypothetical protein
MNLVMASSPQAARSPADIVEKPGPPDPVKQAIEHFVSTGGGQASDPNADQTEKTIRDWVKQVCPLPGRSHGPAQSQFLTLSDLRPRTG